MAYGLKVKNAFLVVRIEPGKKDGRGNIESCFIKPDEDGDAFLYDTYEQALAVCNEAVLENIDVVYTILQVCHNYERKNGTR